jgi:hypothetical protein
MKIKLMILILCATSALAQKNAYEWKLGSQGNGGADGFHFLIQKNIRGPLSCIHGPLLLKDYSGNTFQIVRDGLYCEHSATPIYVGSYGNGFFIYNREGYVWPTIADNFEYSGALNWTSRANRLLTIREFTNGVH